MQANDDALRWPLLAASEMTDDNPHARCRYANDATLTRTATGDQIVWPCGLTVTITGQNTRRRYFLPELEALHDEAERVRRTTLDQLATTARRSRRVQRNILERRSRATGQNPPPRNTVPRP